MDITMGRATIYHAAEQLKTWGRLGKVDQVEVIAATAAKSPDDCAV